METKQKAAWMIEKGKAVCKMLPYPEISRRVWKNPKDLARAIKLDLFLTNSKMRYEDIEENFVFGWFVAVSQLAREQGNEIVLTNGTLRDVLTEFKAIV